MYSYIACGGFLEILSKLTSIDRICGNTPEINVKLILVAIFTNQFAKYYNWAGRNKAKFNVAKTTTMEIVKRNDKIIKLL